MKGYFYLYDLEKKDLNIFNVLSNVYDDYCNERESNLYNHISPFFLTYEDMLDDALIFICKVNEIQRTNNINREFIYDKGILRWVDEINKK